MGEKEKEDSKVTHSDIHEKLWAARDFEINHLWQRSIFLATFITLTFTLYFTAVDKFTADYPSYRVETVAEEQESKGSCYINVLPSDVAGEIDNVSSIEFENNRSISETEDVSYDFEDFFHILILHGISILGFSLSVLWICMARGSKYMYERLEHGIDKAYTADSGFLDKELGDAIRNEFYENLLVMGEYTYLPRHGALPLSDYNYHAFSLDGGKFSSSKINIMIGYLLLCAWVILTLLNPAIVQPEFDFGIKCICLVILYILVLAIFVSNASNKFCIGAVVTFFFIPILIYPVDISLGIIYATLFVDLFFAFLISYAVLSDNKMRWIEFLCLVWSSAKDRFNPEANQKSWVYGFFTNSDGKTPTDILDHVITVLGKYKDSCDDPLQRMILDEFVREKKTDTKSRWVLNREMITRGAVARLLSNEYLKNIFETAIMYRTEFNEPFTGSWGDESGNQLDFHATGDKKDKPAKVVTVTFQSAGLNGDDFDLSDNTKLFADTDWTSIRAGNDYELIKDDKCIHLVHENKNVRKVYMTIDGKDSLLDTPPKLEVTLTVIDPAGDNGEKTQHTYEYTLTKNKEAVSAPDNNKQDTVVVDGKKKFHVSGTVSFDLNADVEEIKDEQGSAE